MGTVRLPVSRWLPWPSRRTGWIYRRRKPRSRSRGIRLVSSRSPSHARVLPTAGQRGITLCMSAGGGPTAPGRAPSSGALDRRRSCHRDNDNRLTAPEAARSPQLVQASYGLVSTLVHIWSTAVSGSEGRFTGHVPRVGVNQVELVVHCGHQGSIFRPVAARRTVWSARPKGHPVATIQAWSP